MMRASLSDLRVWRLMGGQQWPELLTRQILTDTVWSNLGLAWVQLHRHFNTGVPIAK